MSSFLSDFFGPSITKIASILYPKRPTVNYVGTNGIAITAADDEVNNQTTLTIDGTGAGGTPGLHASTGWFNPLDYGAKHDGLTDDWPAYTAMSAAMPLTGGKVAIPFGSAWLSRTWYPDRRCIITGCGGQGAYAANETRHFAASGFEVACGFAAIGLNTPAILGGASDCTGTVVENLDINSSVMVPQNITNGDQGHGVQRYDSTFYSTPYVRVGECFTKSDNSAKTIFYRAISMTAYSGRGPNLKIGMTPGMPPTGTPVDPTGWAGMTLGGSTYTDPTGVTWKVEAFPTPYQTGHAYTVGQRVLAFDDNRYYFECTTAGTSDGAPIGPLKGGGTDSWGGAHVNTYGDNGIAPGSTLTEIGGVKWLVKFAPGIYAACPRVVFRRLNVNFFLGPSFAFTSSWPAGDLAADEGSIIDCDSYYCGLGIWLSTDDANVIHIHNVNVLNAGGLWPYRSIDVSVPSYGGYGGHGVHCGSLGPVTIDCFTIQGSSGRPLVKSNAAVITLISAHSEIANVISNPVYGTGITDNSGGIVVVGETSFIMPSGSSSCVILDPLLASGRGFKSVDLTAAPANLFGALAQNDGRTVMSFGKLATTGGVYTDRALWGLVLAYQVPTGYWGCQYFTDAGLITNAYLLSNADASGASGRPGPGWLVFPEGFFIGSPTGSPAPTFRGDVSAEADKVFRAGERLKGDEFSGGVNTRTCVSSGYRGAPWALPTPTTVTAYASATGVPGFMVEPSTNTGTRNGGERVFRCTTGGVTHGTPEPTWPTTLSATVVDGTATWTLIGFTPTVALKGELSAAPNTVVDELRAEATTTTAAAAQVIATYVLDSPPSGDVHSVRLRFTVVGGNGTAGTGSADVDATFVVASSGAITRIGSDTITVKGMNAATFAIDIATANTFKLTVTPGSAVTNNWHMDLRATKGLFVTN